MINQFCHSNFFFYMIHIFFYMIQNDSNDFAVSDRFDFNLSFISFISCMIQNKFGYFSFCDNSCMYFIINRDFLFINNR